MFVRDKANAILYYVCAKERKKEAVSPYLYYSMLTQTTAFSTSSSPISNEEWTAYKLSASNLFAGEVVLPQRPSLVLPDNRQSCRELSISLGWVTKFQSTWTIRNVHPLYFSNSKLTFWVTKSPTLAHFICSPVPQASQLTIPSIPFFLTSVILQAPPQKIWSHCNLLYLKINQPPFGPFPSPSCPLLP